MPKIIKRFDKYNDFAKTRLNVISETERRLAGEIENLRKFLREADITPENAEIIRKSMLQLLAAQNKAQAAHQQLSMVGD